MTIICPQCSQRDEVGPEYSGEVFQCSHCGASIFVPVKGEKSSRDFSAGQGETPALAPSQLKELRTQTEFLRLAFEQTEAQLKELRTQTEILKIALDRTEKIHMWVQIIGIPMLIVIGVAVFGFLAGFAHGAASAMLR